MPPQQQDTWQSCHPCVMKYIKLIAVGRGGNASYQLTKHMELVEDSLHLTI